MIHANYLSAFCFYVVQTALSARLPVERKALPMRCASLDHGWLNAAHRKTE